MLLRAKDGSSAQLRDGVGELFLVLQLERKPYAVQLTELPVPTLAVPQRVVGAVRIENRVRERVAEVPERGEVLRRIGIGGAAPVENADESPAVDEEVLVPEVAVPQGRLEALQPLVAADLVPPPVEPAELVVLERSGKRRPRRLPEGVELQSVRRRVDVPQTVERA